MPDSTIVGYIVMSRWRGSDEQWLADHSGECWTHPEAMEEARGWLLDNPEYEVAIGAVRIESVIVA